MTAALDGWHIRRIDVPEAVVPSRSRVLIAPTSDELTLEISGTGSMTVTADGAVTYAPDGRRHQVLAAVGGDWACGQWCALRGEFAFHGATVERDGSAIAILGLPRSGCSLTGLSLVRRGWRLVADGTCLLSPIDPVAGPSAGLQVCPGRPSIQVDAMITTALPPSESFSDGGTPRPRNELTVPTSGPCRLRHIVVLQLSNLRTAGVMVGSDAEGRAGAVRALRHTSVIGEALQWADPALAHRLDDFCDQVVDTVPVGVALVPPGEGTQSFSPRQIADLVEEHLLHTGNGAL